MYIFNIVCITRGLTTDYLYYFIAEFNKLLENVN